MSVGTQPRMGLASHLNLGGGVDAAAGSEERFNRAD